MIEKRQFLKNLIVAFSAQSISLLISIVMSLVVPKFLSVTEYSYWQLFIFYTGYVGFFHFGFNDGLYLKLGGQDYKNLDYAKLGTEFKIFLAAELLVSVTISAGALAFTHDSNRQYVILWTAIYLVLNNATLFFGYIFQAVNETKTFSYSIIVDRLTFLFFIALLFFTGKKQYAIFVIAYAICKAVALFYVVFKGKEIFFGRLTNIKIAARDMWTCTTVGIKLTIANVASMLILGVGRLVIDSIWGIETFGRISLSLSLTNFFLLFVQQVSMVLFPALRRVGKGQLESLYIHLRMLLGVVLPVIFVVYIPMKFVLSLWLPQYAESLKYLVFLLPICTFDGKMQMLYNTYLKVRRDEKKLLQINILSLAVSASLIFISGYVLHSFLGVIISMLIAIAFRSFIAEIYLSQAMRLKIDKTLFYEIVIVIIFVSSAWLLPGNIAFAVIALAYGVYLFLNKNNIKQCLKVIRR